MWACIKHTYLYQNDGNQIGLLFPPCTSEQGNVIGLLSGYCMFVVYKKKLANKGSNLSQVIVTD